MAKGIVKGIGSGGTGGMGAIAPPPPPPRPAPPAPGRPAAGPAAIVQISAAGRAALAKAQPPTPPTPGGTMLREMTTGADWDYRLYGPGHAHWGNARQPAPTPPAPSTGATAIEVSDSTTGSDQFQTTSPGHKTVGELAHEAAHVVQQRVRVATGDLDGDGRADVAVNGPPSGAIQNVQKAKHDAMMAAIGNIR